MKLVLLSLCAPVLALPLISSPAEAPAAPLPAPFHCQVPCGIYGDTLRIDLLMEDAATIEKGMNALAAYQTEGSPNINQMVRWTMTKEDHAQKIQDQVAAYWLAQRIKLPAADADAEARAKYTGQLALLHGITVAAMKCKQTTDVSHVGNLRKLAVEFSGTYFSGEDLAHIKSHHDAEHK